MEKLEVYAKGYFTPEELAQLKTQTMDVDEYYRMTWYCDLLSWAIETRLAETKFVKYLDGIFNGIVHMVGVYPNGLPRFAVEHGKEGEL